MDKSLLNNVSDRIVKMQANLRSSLDLLEIDRLDLLRRERLQTIIVIISLLVVAVAFFLTKQSHVEVFIVLFLSILIAYVFFSYFYVWKYKKELEEKFLKNFVPQIIDEFFPEAKYSAYDHINMNQYSASGLFNQHVDRYDGNNLLHGCFGKTQITFSFLHTEYKTETRNKNGGTTTTWHTIFKGIFMIADCNKTFRGETYIVPDKAERLFGGVGKWLQDKFGSIGKGEMVYLESPEFEKKFVVYSTDPVEARYLLTLSMQQYLVDLHKHINGRNLRISYKEGNIYIALSNNSKLFKMNTKLSFYDTETIGYYTNDLVNILEVIEILDLNTRIWGK